ncbi:MAG: hypothetical protein QXN52_10145, partial [Nitrososphaerota archaeon]
MRKVIVVPAKSPELDLSRIVSKEPLTLKTTNLIKNGSFEEGFKYWTITQEGGTVTYSITNEKASDGEVSLKYQGDYGAYLVLSQIVDAKELTFYLLKDDFIFGVYGPQDLRVIIEYYDAKGNLIISEETVNAPAVFFGIWNRIEKKIITPAACKKMKITLKLRTSTSPSPPYSQDVSYIDNIVLVEIPAEKNTIYYDNYNTYTLLGTGQSLLNPNSMVT